MDSLAPWVVLAEGSMQWMQLSQVLASAQAALGWLLDQGLFGRLER